MEWLFLAWLLMPPTQHEPQTMEWEPPSREETPQQKRYIEPICKDAEAACGRTCYGGHLFPVAVLKRNHEIRYPDYETTCECPHQGTVTGYFDATKYIHISEQGIYCSPVESK